MTPAFQVLRSAQSALPPDTDLFYRVRGGFLEMPGLRLTFEQAMRLFALDRTTCACILDALMGMGFLTRDRTNRYVRFHGGY